MSNFNIPPAIGDVAKIIGTATAFPRPATAATPPVPKPAVPIVKPPAPQAAQQAEPVAPAPAVAPETVVEAAAAAVADASSTVQETVPAPKKTPAAKPVRGKPPAKAGKRPAKKDLLTLLGDGDHTLDTLVPHQAKFDLRTMLLIDEACRRQAALCQPGAGRRCPEITRSDVLRWAVDEFLKREYGLSAANIAEDGSVVAS